MNMFCDLTIAHTCNGGIELWLVCFALCLSKSLAKHGLGWKAFLCHKSERSSGPYIRNISSHLSQYRQITSQVAAWLVRRDCDYNTPTVQLLEIISQLNGGILVSIGVKKV